MKENKKTTIKTPLWKEKRRKQYPRTIAHVRYPLEVGNRIPALWSSNMTVRVVTSGRTSAAPCLPWPFLSRAEEIILFWRTHSFSISVPVRTVIGAWDCLGTEQSQTLASQTWGYFSNAVSLRLWISDQPLDFSKRELDSNQCRCGP